MKYSGEHWQNYEDFRSDIVTLFNTQYEAFVLFAYTKAGLPFNPKILNMEYNDLQGSEPYKEMVNKVKVWHALYSELKIMTLMSEYPGCGKTHLSVAKMKQLIDDYIGKCREKKINRPDILNGVSKRFKYVKEYELFYEIRECFKQSSDRTEREVIEKYCKYDFLVIDDIFKAKEDGDFTRRVIYTILDRRVDWYGLPTMLTTNKLLPEIKDIDRAIASRMDNSLLFTIKSEQTDRRRDYVKSSQ